MNGTHESASGSSDSPPVGDAEGFKEESDTQRRRRERAGELREQFDLRTKGAVEAYKAIHKAIEDDPDISKNDLSRLSDELGEQYLMTPEQQFIMQVGIQRYLERHARVRRIMREYSFGKEERFVRDHFKFVPKGKVELQETPNSIAVHFYEPADFFSAYFDFPFKNLQDALQKQKDWYGTGRILAAAVGERQRRKLPSQHGLVTIVNTGFVQERHSPAYIQRMVSHEAQHGENQVLTPISQTEQLAQGRKEQLQFLSHKIATFFGQEQYSLELFESYLYSLRNVAERLACDEVIAQIRDKRRQPQHIAKLFSHKENKRKENKPPKYDFLKYDREMCDEYLHSVKNQDQREKLGELKERVLVHEYETLIKRALEGYEAMKTAGYDTDACIAILLFYPLRDWPKVARRLAPQKKEVPTSN